jgi:hypothetical protein
MALVCWNCGASLESIPLPVSRHAHCQSCFEPVHSCRMCRFYAESRPGQCDDERADPPTQKENANFCEYFKPRFNAYSNQRGIAADSAKARLESLFGGSSDSVSSDDSTATSTPTNPSVQAREAAAKTALDALFGSPTKK